MDAEVEALARELRLDEARRLALARGDAVRALELAIEARDRDAIRSVVSGLAIEHRVRARASATRMREPFAEACVAEVCGELDDAVTSFERAEAFADAARIHQSRGDVAKAGRALERQVQRDPSDVGARKALAELLLAAGRADACLRTLAELPDDDVGLLRARAHRMLGLADGEPELAAPIVEDSRLLFGRYEVVRDVASTPTSRVLEALDRLDPNHPRVALKIFTGTGHQGAGRDALVRFQREVEALAQLDAPSVMRPRAFLNEGPTLVLPWAGGGNVETLLARGLPSPRRAAEITSRVLAALEAAHRRGIIHRDVKPANVLLDEAGGAFLADFGVAHLGDSSATATAGVIGTVRYMSPEQRRGEPATPRSDLYSVGVLLADLLGLPLEHPGAEQPGAPAAWTELPAPIRELLAGLLAEDDRARPADAARVRAQLEQIAWPDEPLGRSAQRSVRPKALAGESRFEPRGRFVRDRLLDRDELRVGVGDGRFALACALATVSHPALPAVLGLDGEQLRVEGFEGPKATELTRREREELAEALTLLHRAGASHGAVGTSVVRSARSVVLAFPDARDDDASPKGDLAALARL